MKPFEKLPHNMSILGDEIYLNEKYQVNVRFLSSDIDGLVWLSIKRIDKEVIHDWREMQLIKNMICGQEREGVELYPAESRLVDTSNQFHIFVLPKGERFPFGYNERLVAEGNDSTIGGKQRNFNPDEKPEDCKTLQDVEKMIAMNKNFKQFLRK